MGMVMDITDKLRAVADKKDVDILAKHLVCHEAAREIEQLRKRIANMEKSRDILFSHLGQMADRMS